MHFSQYSPSLPTLFLSPPLTTSISVLLFTLSPQYYFSLSLPTHSSLTPHSYIPLSLPNLFPHSHSHCLSLSLTLTPQSYFPLSLLTVTSTPPILLHSLLPLTPHSQSSLSLLTFSPHSSLSLPTLTPTPLSHSPLSFLPLTPHSHFPLYLPTLTPHSLP